MSKSEIIHNLYMQCLDINFDEVHTLIENAQTKEEKNFIRMITDFALQQKQKKVVGRKEF